MFSNNPFPNFGFGGGLNNFPQRFDEHYRCYPVSFCDKAHLEDGDKILLPPSALDTLARLNIDYPMLFKLENESVNRHSHCGVLEFSAPEGTCYMPYWMMQNLFITEGGMIHIQSATLPKATFVKIRPQSKEFLDISNPRAVLEGSLRKFSCMTVGDTICLRYNNKNFFLDVREVKPAEAACIIETDCEVDFEAPADYIPPAPAQSSSASSTSLPPTPATSLPFGGVPTVSSGKGVENHSGRPLGSRGGLRFNKSSSASTNNVSGNLQRTDAAELRRMRLQKYESFHGNGNSLDGTITNSTVSLAAKVSVAHKGKDAENSVSNSKQSSESIENVKVVKDKKKGDPFEGQGNRLR